MTLGAAILTVIGKKRFKPKTTTERKHQHACASQSQNFILKSREEILSFDVTLCYRIKSIPVGSTSPHLKLLPYAAVGVIKRI